MALPGADVTVEMYLSGAWTDITSYVRAVDGITIVHGIRGESGTADPNECTLTVDNRDGRFTPKNPTGPYYGQLQRNTGLRVTVGAVVRFVGEVAEFPPTWDPTGNDVTTTLTAAGPLRRLNRARGLESPFVRAIPTLSQYSNITGWWPMEDAGGSGFASALPDGNRMQTVAGSPQYAAYTVTTGFDGMSRPLPTLAAGDILEGIPAPGSGTGFTAAMMIGFPDTSLPDETELFRVEVNGTANLWVVYYDLSGTGALRLKAFAVAAGGSYTEILNQNAAFVLDGFTRYVKLEVADDGANVDYALSVFVPTGSGGGTLSGQLNAYQVGAPRTVQINWTGLADGVSYGHVILAQTSNALFSTRFDPGMQGYNGESVDDRMVRIADAAGVAMDVLTNTTGDVADSILLGPEQPGTPLDVMRLAELTDGGILRDSIDERNELVYSTRRYKYNNDPVLELDYAAGHLSPNLEPTDDDQLLANDVTVTRIGGSSARATIEAGPLSTEAPPDGVGLYAVASTVNAHTDAQLPSIANWLLSAGTLDQTRFPEVTVDLTKNPSLAADVELVRPGRLITITNLPEWASAETVRLHVQGWTEYLTPARRVFTFYCAPADLYDVVRLNDSEYGRLDSDTTTLNEALDTTETGVDYTGGTWITTATHPSEFPFDIEIGGEIMTVTSATGTTFTVTRSVNGVVKSHTLGDRIRLARPNRIAL